MSTMEKSAKVKGKIQETLSGIEVVKTFAKEGRETAEIKTGLHRGTSLTIASPAFFGV